MENNSAQKNIGGYYIAKEPVFFETNKYQRQVPRSVLCGFDICHVKNIIDDVWTDRFVIWLFLEYLWDIDRKYIWQRCRINKTRCKIKTIFEKSVKRKLKKSAKMFVFVKIDNVGHVKSSMY